MKCRLGGIELRTPLIAASGTVGSVVEWAEVADVTAYGAAVAKSVSAEPWPGRPPPRLAPTESGMLNGIGIQNPGLMTWIEGMQNRIGASAVPIWGSAVGGDAGEYARVAHGLETAGVTVVELNLSCPNLADGEMFSFNMERSAEVVAAATAAVSIPIGAKLSPNTPDLVGVAGACMEAGASFLTLTNTALGFGVSLVTQRPLLSGGVGGYSGPGLKPLALRCVYEVAQALPGTPIIGCGGVMNGSDAAEYLLAGASAVALGTVHLAEPKAGIRILRELKAELSRQGMSSVADLVGAVQPW